MAVRGLGMNNHSRDRDPMMQGRDEVAEAVREGNRAHLA